MDAGRIPPAPGPAGGFAELVAKKRVLVCCGAGGVGKTTTSAALALAAARAGRRVLVVTIDPSKRLAEALGVERNPPAPVPLAPAEERAAGIPANGSMAVWMLDPQLISDSAVRRIARSEEEAQALMRSPIYRNIARMVAGMQEYTALEALHGFHNSGSFDLIVLDTPPSRNALNFLEAPDRLHAFLEDRIFQLFIPHEGGILAGTTRRMIGAVLGGVFGETLFRDLQAFFGTFAGIFGILNSNARRMRSALASPEAAFVLVTSPAPAAFEDALFFEDKVRALGLPFGGFVLNRSLAPYAGRPAPGPDLLPAGATDVHRAVLRKLEALAARERSRTADHVALFDELKRRAGAGLPSLAIPDLGGGVDDVAGLVRLADWLVHAPGHA